MINRTSPDLKAIEKIADFNVQFYAIIGAATSLVAEVEYELFVAYVAACGLEPGAAAEIFYRFVKFSHKRDTADKAIRVALLQYGLDLDWTGMRDQLDDLCGDATARNLVGHNMAQQHTMCELRDNVVDVYVANYIQQNEHLVAAERRKPQRETYDTLFAYCEQAVHCANRIRFLGSQLRKARARDRAQEAPA